MGKAHQARVELYLAGSSRLEAAVVLGGRVVAGNKVAVAYTAAAVVGHTIVAAAAMAAAEPFELFGLDVGAGLHHSHQLM
jgi:hypothetical protein